MPPHCWASASACAEDLSADPGDPRRRYTIAACAAASTAATRSPIRSKSSDTAANSGASRSRRAAANGLPGPARGPSTIDSSSRNRDAPERSPNWTCGLQTHHFGRELTLGARHLGGRQHHVDRFADGALACGNPCRGPGSARSRATEQVVEACRAPQARLLPRLSRRAWRARWHGASDSGTPNPWPGPTRTTPPPPAAAARQRCQGGRHPARPGRRPRRREMRCPGQLGGLPPHMLGHLERVFNPAGQQQRADMGVGDVESHVRRVERPRRTAYPASATATASEVRPASAAMTASAQEVSAPTTAGSSSKTRLFDASIAASGWSSANEYIVKNASIHVRASGGVVSAASSMICFAHDRVAEREQAHWRPAGMRIGRGRRRSDSAESACRPVPRRLPVRRRATTRHVRE